MRKSVQQHPPSGWEGALFAISPLPMLVCFLQTTPPVGLWQIIVASLATVACIASSFTLTHRPRLGKLLGLMAAVGCYATAVHFIITDPLVALIASVLLILICFALSELRVHHFEPERENAETYHLLQRAWGGNLMVLVMAFIDILVSPEERAVSGSIVIGSSTIAQMLFLYWSMRARSKTHIALSALCWGMTLTILFLAPFRHFSSIAILISTLSLISVSRSKLISGTSRDWWGLLLQHPARILLFTFLVLSIVGAFILVLPISAKSGGILLIDALFTSVSAVCVTGLIVLDTPHDFSLFGQVVILLLIQLGGLGIMSITTVALHAMGRRLSLKHERLLASMTDADHNHQGLLSSLSTILKVTFICEAIGAILLTLIFHLKYAEALPMAMWRGAFTAISAFCNAGFALQSDSLVPYQDSPAILHIVGLLIILGGMAPATSIIIPRWLLGKTVPIPARIALVTTAVLLISGTLFILAFEWNGVLADLSFFGKVHNAWFQSVTLRTAGFNSVAIGDISSPTLLVMVVFMFIGGSPGGTAGGIKTTTIGILAMTFLTNITNHEDVIVRNRRIPPTIIQRAITIMLAGTIVLVLVIIMLQVTQQVPATDLIFEATSAIGTVGLSTGATSQLDGIGKCIIVLAMFAGRVGPITLFMMLSHEQTTAKTRCPDIKISLT